MLNSPIFISEISATYGVFQGQRPGVSWTHLEGTIESEPRIIGVPHGNNRSVKNSWAVFSRCCTRSRCIMRNDDLNPRHLREEPNIVKCFVSIERCPIILPALVVDIRCSRRRC